MTAADRIRELEAALDAKREHADRLAEALRYIAAVETGYVLDVARDALAAFDAHRSGEQA